MQIVADGVQAEDPAAHDQRPARADGTGKDSQREVAACLGHKKQDVLPSELGLPLSQGTLHHPLRRQHLRRQLL